MPQIKFDTSSRGAMLGLKSREAVVPDVGHWIQMTLACVPSKVSPSLPAFTSHKITFLLHQCPLPHTRPMDSGPVILAATSEVALSWYRQGRLMYACPSRWKRGIVYTSEDVVGDLAFAE